MKFSDLKSLGVCFWVISFNCFLIYSGVVPFNNISTGLVREQYNFSQTTAAQLISIPYFTPVLFAPLFGYLVDKGGHRVTLCTFSAIFLCSAHMFFVVLGGCDKCYVCILPLIFIGLAYSLYAAALWPMKMRGRMHT